MDMTRDTQARCTISCTQAWPCLGRSSIRLVAVGMECMAQYEVL